MEVSFSEIATAGLRQLFPDKAKRAGVDAAIIWKLTRDPGFQSRPVRIFVGRDMWVGRLFAGIHFRVLYEEGKPLTIWSIAPTTPDSTG